MLTQKDFFHHKTTEAFLETLKTKVDPSMYEEIVQFQRTSKSAASKTSKIALLKNGNSVRSSKRPSNYGILIRDINCGCLKKRIPQSHLG
jgi:hypothetical protein